MSAVAPGAEASEQARVTSSDLTSRQTLDELYRLSEAEALHAILAGDKTKGRLR